MATSRKLLFYFLSTTERHIWGLQTNNFSHIFLEIKNSRSVYVFEQVLPYRATISIVLKWQFCVKWLSYLCKLSVNDVLLKFCALIRGLFIQFIFKSPSVFQIFIFLPNEYTAKGRSTKVCVVRAKSHPLKLPITISSVVHFAVCVRTHISKSKPLTFPWQNLLTQRIDNNGERHSTI